MQPCCSRLQAAPWESNGIYVLAENIENGRTQKGTIIGNSLNNILEAKYSPNAVLDGGAGADIMRVSGPGNNSGSVTYVVDNVGDQVVTSSQLGDQTDNLLDHVKSSIDFTLGSRFEYLTLIGIGNINGTGNTLGNMLTGNSGNNLLNGGAGDDTIIGGAGTDSLTGSTGANVFGFNFVSDSTVGAGRDIITDFNVAQLNKIDLSGIDAIASTSASNEAFSYIGIGAFSNAAGQLRFSAGIVSGDVNGDSISDFEIQLTGNHFDGGSFYSVKIIAKQN